MGDWNAKAVSERFRAHAEELERRILELRAKLSASPVYEFDLDVALGEFYVYNYIHGKTFLGSRESFCAELDSLLLSQSPLPSGAVDPKRAALHYRRTLEHLCEAHCGGSTRQQGSGPVAFYEGDSVK